MKHFPPKLLPPKPEADDNYVGAELLLPRGDSMAQGRVTKRLRNNNGNPVGRANANPILDTREYVMNLMTAWKPSLLPIPLLKICMHSAILTETNMSYLTH